MPKENTANRALARQDQSLTTLFDRLTDDLTELFDAKLQLLNEVSFSATRTMKCFPSSRCASATKIVRPREPRDQHSLNLIGSETYEYGQ
jgi:hypothetical protein